MSVKNKQKVDSISEEELSEEGLNKDDIKAIMAECECSRQIAIKALRKHNSDLTKAILDVKGLKQCPANKDPNPQESNKPNESNKHQNNKNKKSNAKANNEKNPDDSISIWKVWTAHPPITLPKTSLTFRGYSLAALRTNFYIKELGLMLDSGLSSPNMTITHLLITHCHSDHVANLPYHIYSYKEPDKIQIYVPKGIEKHIKAYIESAYLLSSHTFPEEEGIKREDLYLYNFFDLITVEPGNIIPITIKKKQYGLEIFKCFHQVPCVGYGVYEIRQKLKEEYKNLKGKEIGELKSKGVEITYNYYDKFICYLGDTSAQIFGEGWDKIAEYRNIVIECTFIKEDDLEQADKTNHIHWKSIEPIIDKYKDNTFILIHFSQRYDNSELVEFFENQKKGNVIPWIN